MERGDIDIDVANRDLALKDLHHTAASIISDDIKKHNTGVYFHKVPIDPVTDLCSIDYKKAEEKGLYKIDLLNVGIYERVRDEAHLNELMKEPKWENLDDFDFFVKMIHIGNHYKTYVELPEKIRSIEQLAMFLAIIRPGKKHLQGKKWSEIEKEVWIKDSDLYMFHKPHAISYAYLVVVNMNLENQD